MSASTTKIKTPEEKQKEVIVPEQIENPYADLFSLIQDKQVELALKESQKKEVKVDGQTYTRKPLSTKQWREIFILNDKMTKIKDDELKRLDALIELRTKGAEYYFGIPSEVFDKYYEDLSPIMEGCILRSNTGLSPDIDFEEILQKYKAQAIKK